MRYFYILTFIGLLIFLSACQNASNVCPATTGTPVYLSGPPDKLSPSLASSSVVPVKIGWQTVQMDKIVEGQLCNDTWSGNVYVGCDVQVYPWKEQPTFLKDCELSIEPGTVVYVAYHNNAAYYNGCSCHNAPTPTP